MSIRLPDGSPAENPEEFAKEWQKFIDPLEKGLGVRVLGFDPGFSITDADGKGSCELPMWMAKKIINVIKYHSYVEDSKEDVILE